MCTSTGTSLGKLHVVPRSPGCLCEVVAEKHNPTMLRLITSQVGDPFEFLGVSEDASKDEIRQAYAKLILKYHHTRSDLPMEEAGLKCMFTRYAYHEVHRRISGPKPIRLDSPDGLSADERMTWLINKNKVVLFMRGTKQNPIDTDTEEAVAILSSAAFDTKQRFAAWNIESDCAVGVAVKRKSSLRSPVCYIDGKLIGGTEELRGLHESGELRKLFGGANVMPPCPEDLLEWRCGEWREPEDWEQQRQYMRIERDPITAQLRWTTAKKTAKGALQLSSPKAVQAVSKASDIESLVNFRLFKGSEQWRVRWRGCGPDEDTWERWDKLDSPELQERAKMLRSEEQHAVSNR